MQAFDTDAQSSQITLLELQRAWGGHGRIPLSFSLRVLLEVMVRLEQAHARGEIHGELSPGHILLVENCGVQLAAPSRVPLHARNRAASFPLHYLAPETLRGSVVDARADVFSMGALLWEVLAGQAIVEAFTVKDVLMRWRIEPAPVCPVRSPLLWARSLAHIAARALAMQPAERYANVRHMYAAVELLGGRHVAKPEAWNALLRWPLPQARPRLPAPQPAQREPPVNALPTLSLHGPAHPDDRDTIVDLSIVASDRTEAELPMLGAYFGFGASTPEDELPTRFMTPTARVTPPRAAMPIPPIPPLAPASSLAQANLHIPDLAVPAPVRSPSSSPAPPPAPRSRVTVIFVVVVAALVGAASSLLANGSAPMPNAPSALKTAPVR